ncbi:MAG: hypothetical protein H0W40_18600 [Methylibium sp.]|uniref:hypothetical protein n=1 Tax=Methylibium sp. TaxID=2067992 RepID=UPI00181EBFA3|nr:hypothetical protein [Methylibium sp.]MBA3599360.1 hypothetical protein [Methylibium sp.]
MFEIDLEHCPNCGGELTIIAAILEPRRTVDPLREKQGLLLAAVFDSSGARSTTCGGSSTRPTQRFGDAEHHLEGYAALA